MHKLGKKGNIEIESIREKSCFFDKIERRMEMAVRIEKDENSMTAYIQGEIDHHSATEIREAIDFAAESSLPGLLVLDFRDVTFMDSSGIGLVMGRYKLMQSMGGELHLKNISNHIQKVMRLAGLDKLAVIDK